MRKLWQEACLCTYEWVYEFLFSDVLMRNLTSCSQVLKVLREWLALWLMKTGKVIWLCLINLAAFVSFWTIIEGNLVCEAETCKPKWRISPLNWRMPKTVRIAPKSRFHRAVHKIETFCPCVTNPYVTITIQWRCMIIFDVLILIDAINFVPGKASSFNSNASKKCRLFTDNYLSTTVSFPSYCYVFCLCFQLVKRTKKYIDDESEDDECQLELGTQSRYI